MEVVKAGCYLINIKNKKVALIYREKQKDFSFPKGHLENNETIEQCAVRETAEETKRVAKIVKDIEPYVERYTNLKGEKCVCFMFVAIDNGKSDNTSTDAHETFWFDVDEVEEKLTYQSLKNTWNAVKDKIKTLLK